jgi:hypothetical protein
MTVTDVTLLPDYDNTDLARLHNTSRSLPPLRPCHVSDFRQGD